MADNIQQEKRKFGVVKRPTTREDFWQWVLEGFIDYKGWQRLLLILAGIGAFLLLIAYFPSILLVGVTILPFYFVVHWLVGKFRRVKYSALLLLRIMHKQVQKTVTIGDNYDITIETIETTSDAADLKMVPENIIQPTASKDGINFVNVVSRRMPNGRKLYIAETLSTDQDETDEDHPAKKQKGPLTAYGAPDESFGNVALLTAVAGITLKVNPKFEKVLKKIEDHGQLEPQDIARLRSNMKTVYDLIGQANDIIYAVQEEIQMFPFDPIDVRTLKKRHERQFVVGMAKWKGEWAEKMARLGDYRHETPDSLMPHMLSLAEQANHVSQQLIEIGLFSKQMQGRATLAALEQLLKIFGYDSEEIKRVIEVEVKRKGLIPTTEIAEEQDENKEEPEEVE